MRFWNKVPAKVTCMGAFPCRVSSNIIPVNAEGFIASDAAGTILMGISKKSLLNGTSTMPAHLVFSNFPASLDFLALSIPQVLGLGFSYLSFCLRVLETVKQTKSCTEKPS